MNTPANSGARSPEDVVVDTRYIPCSRSCGSRAGNLRDAIFVYRLLKRRWLAAKLSGCRACHSDEDHNGRHCCDCTVVPNGATSRGRGSLMAVPNPTQDRHGVRLNTELACGFLP